VIQKLVWENVKHRPLRTFLSALLIAIPVTLVLTLTGLSKGMMEDATKRYRGVGADIVIRPRGSNFLSLGSSPISEKYLDVIRQQPHVALATGIVIQSLGDIFSSAAGIDLKQFDEMSGGLEYVEGGPLRDPDDLIVDEYYAHEKKLHAGDKVDLLNQQQKWRISGVVKPGKLNRVFMDLRRLQDLTGNTGKVQLIYVKVDDPKNINTVISELQKLLVDYPIRSMDEYTALFTSNNIPALSRFTSVMVGIAIFIGFAVVCLSMYMAVLQRTREIGILKSLGASRWYVLSIILREAVLLAIVGTVLGIAMSYGAKWMLQTLVPASFPPAVDPAWWPAAAAIALTGAVLGALYPGLRAANMDPIEALSYE
jgi:putative ABC transport system permease protein